MVKKAKGFFDGKKKLFFKILRSKISKILKFCSLRDFFNFLLAITFDAFHASKLKFSIYALYWEFYRKIKNQIVIG